MRLDICPHLEIKGRKCGLLKLGEGCVREDWINKAAEFGPCVIMDLDKVKMVGPDQDDLTIS